MLVYARSLNPEADEKSLKPGDALCVMPAVCPEGNREVGAKPLLQSQY
jgi:hypothetical protein